MLVFCYLLNLLDLIWVLLYESLTFSFNHSLWLMFKQAKASGEMSSWKMHDSPYINHIKSWATCFLRVVFWEDPWLFYRAGRVNLMFFSSFVLRTLSHQLKPFFWQFGLVHCLHDPLIADENITNRDNPNLTPHLHVAVLESCILVNGHS